MKEKARTLTPRLRFPEFRERSGWGTCALERIAERVTTRNSDRAHSRVLTNSAERGVLDQRDYFDREIATAGSIDTYYVVERGDYVYNPRTSATAPVGPISRNNLGPGVMSPLYTVFRFADDPTDFYEHYFKSAAWHSYVRSASSTGARHDRMSITSSAFMQMPVPTPDPAEQRKIAACLTSLDECIAAEGQKLKAFRVHRQGLMQQLFPHEGESRPRLRFPEFRHRSEWEETVGGKLFTNRIEGGEQALPIYSVTVNEGMVPRASFDRDFYDIEDPAGNKKACKGDLTYNMMRMWQGAQGVALEDCMVSPAYVVLAPLTDVCSEFFAHLFKLPQSLDLLTAHSRGLTKDRLRLYFEDFKRLPLRVPQCAEQQRVAACLSSIDRVIAAQCRKVDGLRAHKKGLMQQLFPSPGRP